ncbi:MAG TPA: lysylphosphatidylglycerol synthase domain-containing protein, partial [Thermoanaerobaculia bacterium]|nr:lysylphosphatidylglycerol synthase domain-containing protein [Thermoanaerobaculia bacterium]
GRLGELRAAIDLGGLWRWLAGAALAHAALNVLVAFGWWRLAGIYGRRPSFAAGYVVYSLSRLMKYLPGNVLHYLGRQVLGVRAGIGHEALVASAVIEMSGLIAAAAGATLLCLGLGGGGLATGGALALVGAAVVLLGWPAIDRVARRLPGLASRMAGLPRLALADLPRLYAPTLVSYLGFFLGAGAVLLALAVALAPEPPADPWAIVGLYPAAWIAGTVAIGAPAGLGVREAILTLGLTPQVGALHASVLALSLRVVTLVADLLTAGAGVWLRSRLAGAGPAGSPAERSAGSSVR